MKDVTSSPIASEAATLPKKHGRFRKQIISLVVLAVVLVLMIILAVSLGTVDIPFLHTLGILASKIFPFVNFENPPWPAYMETILWDTRLPRVLMAGLVGAALSIAGATYQGLFRNPLADPYLIGVSQGAAFGAVAAMILPFSLAFLGSWMVPVFAFLGAILVVFLVYNISKVGRTLPTTTLILAGVALGAFFSAGVTYLITVVANTNDVQGVMFWLSGSFNGTTWSSVWVVFPILLIGSIILMFFGRSLNLMQLGDDQAKQLGLNVERDKKILLTVSTIVTAAGVSFVGIIGFVGIIVPHAVRLIWGPDYRFLLPLSILLGSIFMIACDFVLRFFFSPIEVPIGVITAIIGAPFFIYLLRTKIKSIF